jgi:hypothetical protein
MGRPWSGRRWKFLAIWPLNRYDIGVADTARAQIEAGVTIAVTLAEVTIDPSIQPRISGLNRDHVEALMSWQDELPPVLLARREGRLVLVDGFHRFARSQNLGEEEILAVVVDLPPDTDLRELAFELNRKHGLPLTLADCRAEAARQLRRTPEISDREVGRRCGLTQPTVAKVRRALEAGAEIEPTEIRVGRGGYRYSTQPREGRTAEAGEEAEHRRLGVSLCRLSVSLDRLGDLPAWTSPENAAACLAETYEEDDARGIVDSLGRGSVELLAVAKAGGFDPGDESQ